MLPDNPITRLPDFLGTTKLIYELSRKTVLITFLLFRAPESSYGSYDDTSWHQSKLKKYYPQTIDSVPYKSTNSAYKPERHPTMKGMKMPSSMTDQYRPTDLPAGANLYASKPFYSMKKPPANENIEAFQYPTTVPKLKEPYYQYYPRVKYTTSPQLPALEVSKNTPPIINERYFLSGVKSSQMLDNNLGKGIQMKNPGNGVRAPYPYEKPMLPNTHPVAVLKPTYSIPKISNPEQYYGR